MLVIGSTRRFGVPKKGDIFQMTDGNMKREGRKEGRKLVFHAQSTVT